MYLVLSALTSSPISLVAATKASHKLYQSKIQRHLVYIQYSNAVHD